MTAAAQSVSPAAGPTVAQSTADELRVVVARLVGGKRLPDAIAAIENGTNEEEDSYDALLLRAELLDDAQDFSRAGVLFANLLDRFPERRELRINIAKRLRRRGLIADAHTVIAPAAPRLAPGSRALALAEELAALHQLFLRLEGGVSLGGVDVRTLAMKHAVLHFGERSVTPQATAELGRTALITGSVGPGGAERQMTRIARLLQEVHKAGALIAGTRVTAAPEVIVKSHGVVKRNDFFLPELIEAGVTTSEINEMPSIPSRKQDLAGGDLARLLDILPPQVNYGVTRLTPYLRERGMAVVSLWQDGAVLFGALAALLAGVPRIQLVFRGLPPSIRQDRHRPEYESLFTALALVPGVQFICNSHAAATAYARWLALPAERFVILYNGVERQVACSRQTDDGGWRAFEAATGDATETIGGIFRFESDKRPLLWIRLAHRYLKRRPRARFVIVGHGRLFEAGMALAAELGIADRILFAGHSLDVGSWYDRFNALVLMSRYEGLPNVLVEAQMHGVPVVSTPAGGAAECFIEGVTGHILSCAATPDLDEACDRIEALVCEPADRVQRAATAREFADTTFAVPLMLGRFIGIATASPATISGSPS